MKQKGFTLIELLVVIAIIGILGAVAVPKLLSAIGKSRISAAKGDIGAFNSALNLYQVSVSVNRYPAASLKQLIADAVSGWDGPYLAGDAVKRDPWNGTYSYESFASAAQYTIQTTGGTTVNVLYSTLAEEMVEID